MTASVVGCVYGAHQALVERMDRIGEPAPTYEWCEQQWNDGLRNTAPGDRAIPAWLLQELFFRWRHHVHATGQQLALDLGQAS